MKGYVYVTTFDNGNFAVINDYGHVGGQLFDPLGTPVGTDFLQGLSKTIFGSVDNVEVRALSGDKILIAFTSRFSGDDLEPEGYDLPHAAVVDAKTAKFTYLFGGDFRPEDRILAVDADKSGRVAILYEHNDSRGNYTHHLVARDSAGKDIFQKEINLGRTFFWEDPPLTQLPDGTIIITWDKPDAQRKTHETTFSVFDPSSALVAEKDAGIVSGAYPLITVLDEKLSVRSWGSGKDNLHYRIIDASGDGLGKTFVIKDAVGFSHQVAKLNGGGFAIAWKSYSSDHDKATDGGISNVQTVDASGHPAGENIG